MIRGLPERLRNLRLQYGYSQRMAAKLLNVSPSVVSGYETGERTPSLEVLIEISYLYNCSTDYLLGKKCDTPFTAINAEGLTKDQICALAALVETIRANIN